VDRDFKGVMGGQPDFESWYRYEQPRLARGLWAVCGDSDVAADAVDEAFSRALARWDRVSSMDSPTGWVRSVALNHVRRTMRRRDLERRLLRREHVVPPAEPEVDPELWQAVAGLPARQREVVALRYVGDLSEADIAGCLGLSEGAVSASLTKARRRLREVIPSTREVTGS